MRHQYRTVVAVVSLLAIAAADALAAGPGIFRPRNGSGSQPVRRTYRSYSVSPSAPLPAENAPVWEQGGAAPSRPMGAPSQPGRSMRPKPSYMRADSKASGRFGQ